MNASFHTGNRKRLYEAMKPASLLVMFSGEDVRKTNDEYYPFYTDRDFYYLTGLDQHELVLMAVKEPSGNVHEQIYILPPDLMAERWTGARLKPTEVEGCPAFPTFALSTSSRRIFTRWRQADTTP